MPPERANAMDHVVLVLFENRSFDNLLGRLYRPGEVPSFEGVIGKDLTNPIPPWAEHGTEHKVVPYEVADDMDSPNPDPGEEYQHTNTQLFNMLDEANRFKDATEMVAPYNAPADGQVPTMDGFVTDYISFLTVELGRQPTYDEYKQIMTGFTPEQVPVISGIARGFGVFDHWFSEVPSQTLTNRAFWTSATASGFVVNRPMSNFMHHNGAETIFDRLEQHGKTWKVYVLEPDSRVVHRHGAHGAPAGRFATHFVPFTEFERDAAAGTLPDFSLIEPNLLAGHGDYHPAFARALLPGFDVPIDPPSSILAGEAFLARIYDAIRSAGRVGRIERLQHRPVHRLGRARGHLRPRAPRAGAAARPVGPCRPTRFPLRPVGVPGPGHHRLALGGAGRRFHRRVPTHLDDRHPAGRLGSRCAVDGPGRRRPHLSACPQSRCAPPSRHLAGDHRPTGGRIPDGPGGRRRGLLRTG